MADWLDLLAAIPLFSFLGRKELAAVQELFVESTHERGDVICHEGDEGDQFYIVLNGELEVWAGQQERRKQQVQHHPDRRFRDRGPQRQTGTLKRGDCFGEMALLQGGKRTATVKVKRHAKLLSLDKASFDRVFAHNPRTLEYFTRILCRRLASVSKGEAVQGRTMTISVASRPGLRGKTLVASGLAVILHDLTGSDVLLVRVRPGEGAPEGSIEHLLSDELDTGTDALSPAIKCAGPGLSTLDVPARMDMPAAFYVERSSNLISRASEHFRFILFDLGSENRTLIDSAPGFADAIIEIVDKAEEAGKPEEVAATSGSSDTRRFQVINLFNPESRPVCISRCEPFVIPKDLSLPGDDNATYLRANPRAPAALPIHRLARKLLGSAVGLALGGGAAFGIAHLGVLKVLEDNGIPIDLLAGCSQGSIIGVGYAAGVTVQEMIDIALQLGRKKNFLKPLDITFTKPGILAGGRFVDIFSPMLRGRTAFEDLLMPCRTVATDIQTGEQVEIGEGSLADAFRASASVPMVFAPFKLGGRVLVDGGVTDPVPAEVVNRMGADLCIAVNVVPPLKKGLENVVSRAYRVYSMFNPISYFEGTLGLPNMFDIIMNSMQVLQYELGNFKAISADVLINPDLSDFTWIEYYRSKELIERGIAAAEQAMPAVKNAYSQHLAPYRNPQKDWVEIGNAHLKTAA
jgi:NTE family protein